MDKGNNFFVNILNRTISINDLNVVALAQLFKNAIELIAYLGELFLVFVDLLRGTVSIDACHTLLGGEVKENANIGAHNLGAIQIHIANPLGIGATTLICQRRIIITVANDVKSIIEHLLNAVDRVDVVVNTVKDEHCRHFAHRATGNTRQGIAQKAAADRQ